jgi:protein SCO1
VRDPRTGAPTDLAVSHMPFGRVSPVLPVPDLPVRLDDGKAARLKGFFAGQITVMQLMFTGCSATCPIQGALFAEVARQNKHKGVRLVSLSIDPLGDDPKLLKAWMERFGTHPSWRAAVPRVEDVEQLFNFVRGRATGPDPHTAKVYFFDRKSQLVYKTYDLPSVRHIVGLIGEAVALK